MMVYELVNQYMQLDEERHSIKEPMSVKGYLLNFIEYAEENGWTLIEGKPVDIPDSLTVKISDIRLIADKIDKCIGLLDNMDRRQEQVRPIKDGDGNGS